jgi:hypothetical protein
MFWNSVARWISHAPTLRELIEQLGRQRRGAVLHRARQAVAARAPALDSASSASKSSCTSATVPSGSGTPPWRVPVWIEILLMPSSRPASAVERAR